MISTRTLVEFLYDGNEQVGLRARRLSRMAGAGTVSCQADLRCLDAHAHLGNLHFDDRPDDAIRHYEVGMRIGELSLGSDFTGLLPWGWIDNRPFLRCMQSYGLCAWRLSRLDEAGRIFDGMLWLNPSDNQGIRSMIDDVRERRPWEDSRENESW